MSDENNDWRGAWGAPLDHALKHEGIQQQWDAKDFARYIESCFRLGKASQLEPRTDDQTGALLLPCWLLAGVLEAEGAEDADASGYFKEDKGGNE